MDIPEPPYGTLIEVARKSARLSIAEAASRAGVSKATWIDYVRGWRRRKGETETIDPDAGKVAHMAHAVGVTPEQLESEGREPDAAKVLRRVLGGAENGQADLEPEQAPRSSYMDEPDDEAWEMYPDDSAADAARRAIFRATRGRPMHRRMKAISAFDRALGEDGEDGREDAV